MSIGSFAQTKEEGTNIQNHESIFPKKMGFVSDYEKLFNKEDVDFLEKALNIDAGAEVGSWRYSPRTPGQKGTQIDLLFDRTDGVITVCEIKYSDQPFIIDKSYADNLLNKLEIYRKQTRTTKQIFLSIIAANGIKPTIYTEELINGGVAIIDDLFESVIG